VDVADQLQKIAVLLAQDGFVAVLEEVAAPPVPAGIISSVPLFSGMSGSVCCSILSDNGYRSAGIENPGPAENNRAYLFPKPM
jgi:hypothetical protein